MYFFRINICILSSLSMRVNRKLGTRRRSRYLYILTNGTEVQYLRLYRAYFFILLLSCYYEKIFNILRYVVLAGQPSTKMSCEKLPRTLSKYFRKKHSDINCRLRVLSALNENTLQPVL